MYNGEVEYDNDIGEKGSFLLCLNLLFICIECA